MTVEELMTREVRTCRESDPLHIPARLMWQCDCGSIPVVDAENRVVGVITDRDIAMAAYHQDAPLNRLSVWVSMSRGVWTCDPESSVEEAEELMRQHQIRRLPVIESDGRLVGILSLNDIARGKVEASFGSKAKEAAAQVGRTLAAIGTPRPLAQPA